MNRRSSNLLSPQPDKDVDRLRRELEQILQKLLRTREGVRLEDERVGERNWVNFHAGEGVTLAVEDDQANDEVDITISADAAGAGPPVDAEYVVLSADGTLTDERVLTAGAGITVTDSGPGLAVTVASTITQYTDEMAQDAVGGMTANSATVSLTYNDATPSLTAAVIAGSIGTTQLANDGVTFAKTQNIASQRILGRNTAGSGDIEELTFDNDQFQTIGGELAFGEWPSESWYANPTGSDDQPIAVEPGASLHWVGNLLEVNRVVYEVDFSSLANNTFANGTEVIDGLSWTIGNVAASQLFDISNGNGLRFRAANLTTANFTSAAQTASYAYIDLAQLIGSEYDAQAKYIFEIYVSSRTIAAAESSRLYMALWHPTTLHAGGTAQLRGMSLSTNSTDTIAGTHVEATTNAITAMVMNANDVFGLTVEAMGQPTMYAGVWAAGWPAYLNAEICATTNTSTGGSLQRGDVRFVFSFNHGSAAAAVTAYTIQRLRVRRV